MPLSPCFACGEHVPESTRFLTCSCGRLQQDSEGTFVYGTGKTLLLDRVGRAYVQTLRWGHTVDQWDRADDPARCIQDFMREAVVGLVLGS